MSTSLASVLLRLRRAPRHLVGPLLLGAGLAVGLGGHAPGEARWLLGVAVTGAGTLRALLRGSRGGPWWDLEAGFGALLLGALTAPALPPGLGAALTQLLAVAVVTVARGAAGPALVLAAAILAGLLPPPGVVPEVGVGSVIAFGLLALGVTRVETFRARAAAHRALAQDRRQAADDARLYRLVSATESGGRPAPRDDDRIVRSSVDEARHALFHTLEMVHRSLELHTCTLFLFDARREVLRVAERVTAAGEPEQPGDTLAGGPRAFAASQGVFGAIAREGRALRLANVRSEFRGLPWVEGPCPIRSFLGVPVVEGGEVRGVLCADRLVADPPFNPRDEALLERAGEQLLRVMTNERVFLQLERSRYEQSILHRAAQSLGAALDEGAVVEAAFAAAGEVVDHDLRAITTWDPARRKHTVLRADGLGAPGLDGRAFGSGPSLVSMVVTNRHPLPYRGDFDGDQQILFTRKADPRGLRSTVVLPLQVRDDVLGTLVVAARRRRAFGDGARATLEALAHQTAVALANAAAVRRLEEMATTDGLTGCLNKRAFLEAFDAKLKAAARFERPLSLVVTDIDHFKAVNDTHGHATGDVVIKELGGLLRGVKRDTDVVARFGGEEFCVLCEQTDAEGARLLAERIRQQLSERTFSSPAGDFQVTCSLGVATFPVHGDAPTALFEAADQALYRAKRSGRNRVSVCEPLALPARAG